MAGASGAFEGRYGTIHLDVGKVDKRSRLERRGNSLMKYRVGIWGSAGFLVAVGWALYFSVANKDLPAGPIVNALTRATCPIAIAGMHFPISMYWVFLANAATYALLGLMVGTLRERFSHAR